MANPLLGQILGGAFGNAMRARAGNPGPFGRGPGGGLGGVALGGLLGSLMGGRTRGARPSNHRGVLLAMLLPFAMQWVQRNGGIGAVLDRFRQRGYGQHADSWVKPGDNQPLAAEAVDNVVGRDELSRLAQRLGVPEQEVSEALAEILPEMADQLTPEGRVTPEADQALDGGKSEVEKLLGELHADMQHG
jgi:uncharacterized protein YidB (DUF937 family)